MKASNQHKAILLSLDFFLKHSTIKNQKLFYLFIFLFNQIMKKLL